MERLFGFSGGGGRGDGGGGGGRAELAGLVAVKAVAVFIFRQEIGLFLLVILGLFSVWDNVGGGGYSFVEKLAVSCMSME